MRRAIWLMIMVWMCSITVVFGQEIYQWVDESKTIHFTDDPSLIPERYRDQIQKKKPPKELPPPAPSPSSLSPQVPKGTKAEKKIEPPSERKDLLGRGEEWWRAKAKEWNDKFLNAKQNYEAVYSAWKAKEDELEKSKFKPESLKRKLKAESKVLEEKLKEWKNQLDEAKNMLENVLPKQAEEYRADPKWVKIE